MKNGYLICFAALAAEISIAHAQTVAELALTENTTVTVEVYEYLTFSIENFSFKSVLIEFEHRHS